MSTEQFIFHVDAKSVADEGDELSIQAKFIGRLKNLAPNIRCVATPNGGNRSAWEKMRAKREGMWKGWPDIACYWSADGAPQWAHIEFKAKNGHLAPEQIEALNWLTNHGFRCGVFRSVETALAFLRDAGAPFSLEKAA